MWYLKVIVFMFMLMELGMPPSAEAQAKATEATLNRLFQEGAQAYQAADYRTALKKWQEGLKQARALGNKQYSSQLLMNIGAVYWYLGQYEQALASLEQASVIFRELGDRQGEGRILNNIGLVYQNLGKYEHALKSYEESLTLKRITGDRPGEGNALSNIGVVYDKLGQYEQALASFEQALAIARETGDRQMENRVLSGIGLVYKNLGQYKQALASSEQALAIAQEIGDRQGDNIALTGIGLIYTEYGHYEQALEYHQQTLALKRAIGDRQGEGTTLNNIGVVYHRLGQYEHALKYYEQALAIKQAIGDRQGEGMALNNIGTLYDDLKQYEQALEYHMEALAIFQELGVRRDEGLTLGNIGVVYAWLGQYEQALKYFEQSLAIKQAIGDRQGEGTDLSNIGAVYRKHERYEQAYQALKTSLKICQDVGAAKFLWIAQSELAAVEAELEKYDEAVVHYEQALETIETMRAGLSEKETKTSFTQNKLFVYDELITLFQTLHEKYPDKGYNRKALEIFERKQGRVFLEEMGKSGARLFAGLPEAISQRERELETQLEQTRTRLADGRSKPISDQHTTLIQKLEERERTLKSEQASLQEQIKTDYPGYYALKYSKPVTLAELQQNVLQSREIMLIYNVMETNTVLWVIGSNPPLPLPGGETHPKPLPGGDSLQMYMLPVGEQTLQEKTANVRETMLDDWETSRGLALSGKTVQPERLPFPQASHDLYMLLIPETLRSMLTPSPDSPQEGEMRKMLNIVPTGPLYALPFEILLTSSPLLEEDGSTTSSSSLVGEGSGMRYLIEDIPISYLSSASLLKTLRKAQAQRTTTARYPLLAFAHPVYSFDNSQETGTLRGLRIQAYRELLGGGLPELPETAEEAQIVADLLHAPEESDPYNCARAPHIRKYLNLTAVNA